jgi:hypothetical protein
MVFGAGLTPGARADSPFDPSRAASPDTDTIQRKTIFICATGMRASIKNVSFRYNGTDTQLSNLQVERVSDKLYPDEKSKPLWAVETSFPFRMTFDPLWGIVHDRFENAPGLSTMRSDKLWLPETVSQTTSFGLRDGMDSLAAAGGPMPNLHQTYRQILDMDSLTGAFSFPTVERFGRLSMNETSASQIPSLMLTDVLASLLVGTKSALRAAPVTYPARLRIEDPVVALGVAPVAVYRRVIRYDLRYAIPALLMVGLLAAVLCWVVGILAVERLGVLRRLRDMYNQTSTGRLATALLLPGRRNPNESTGEWVEGDGQLVLAFGRIGTRDAGYFLKVERDGEGGRPFLKPEGYGYGYGMEGYNRTPEVKGMGETVDRM